MRAIVIDRFGGPEVLEQRDVAMPEPSSDQVRVRVRTCGVCRHDLLTRAGAFPNIALPRILGHQICGVVDAVGDDVAELAVGDRVLSLVYDTCGRCRACRGGRETLCAERPRFIGEDIDGGYADHVVAGVRSWVRIPEGVDDLQGAVLTCTLGTSFHAIVGRGAAEAGETALVTGATGGVGLHALKVLRAIGVRSIAVTSSSAKVPLLEEAGADHVVVSEAGAFRDAAKQLTEGAGPDLVVEIVGGDSIHESLRTVRFGGRVVVVGNVEGSTATIRPAHLILKEVSLLGTKAIPRLEMERLLSLVERGVLTPSIGEAVPLEDVRDAHLAIANNQTDGRLVLTL